jgi:hypothetical protein
VRAAAVVFAVVVAARAANADPTGSAGATGSAAELEARGEQAAKDGHYSDAIDAFKAADAIAPSAAHKCLIALAYTRRELWPQAEIFMAQCQAGSDAELPSWVPEARGLITARIAEANVAAVTIVVDPAGIGARLTVSSFAPDETFAPGAVIHLPPGHHVLVATAPGFPRVEQAVDIADKTPRQVIIEIGVRSRPPARSGTPRSLIVAGVATLAAGTVAYGVMGIGWVELRSDNGKNFGTKYETMYDVGRVASLSLWTVGAALAATGYVLHRRDARERIAIVPRSGGAALVVELAR